MANSNNWGEIYKSTWWGDEDWSANSLKIDSAPPGFAGGQNLLLGSEELEQSDEGEWERLNINAVDANVSGVANPLSSDETVEKVDFQATGTSRILQDVTLVAGTQYTFSVWAKSAGASNEQFRLRYWDRTASSGGGDLFTALTTDWSPTTGRYSFTFTAASSGVHAMHIQNSGSVQRRIYFWGAMLNEGATAGDYIKTEFTPQLSNPPTPPMEFGDNFVGVTAYYSLRRFTTGEDNNAIRVRRSSDDTEQDIGFDANGDLDTTALTTFVNEDVNVYTSDFSSGTDGFSTNNATLLGAQSVGGESAALKVTLTGGSTFHIASKTNLFDAGATYSVSFKYYIPSGQTVNQIKVGDFDSADQYLGVTDAWTDGTISGDPDFGFFRIWAAQSGSTTVDADGDVFYLKNIVVTQTTADGAVTTWYDQSGNGNDATNSTESEQPLVVSGGSVLVDGNGKAKVKATASSQYLTATRIDPNPLYSFYALEKGTSTGAFSGFTGQWANSYAVFFGSTRASVFDTSGTRHNVARGTTMTSGNRYLISAVFDNDIEIYQDGTLEGSVSAVGDLRFSDASQKLYLFGYSGGNADPDSCLQEVIFFNSDQSANLGTVTTGGGTLIQGNINTYFDIV